MMAIINTKSVHRSNHLLNYVYDRDFVYDDMMMMAPAQRARSAPKRWRAARRSITR